MKKEEEEEKKVSVRPQEWTCQKEKPIFSLIIPRVHDKKLPSNEHFSASLCLTEKVVVYGAMQHSLPIQYFFSFLFCNMENSDSIEG